MCPPPPSLTKLTAPWAVASQEHWTSEAAQKIVAQFQIFTPGLGKPLKIYHGFIQAFWVRLPMYQGWAAHAWLRGILAFGQDS